LRRGCGLRAGEKGLARPGVTIIEYVFDYLELEF
jgi:hypothetical protein